MENETSQDAIKAMCHPFLIALKEGKTIRNNPLDYRLMLLQKRCSEVIRTPKKAKKH